jgi:hypothetical protein
VLYLYEQFFSSFSLMFDLHYHYDPFSLFFQCSTYQANKYLWCDQVLHPSTVGDGKCNPENNVLGCWDGGDCCQATCTDGIKHTCPLLPHDYPSCAATFLPGTAFVSVLLVFLVFLVFLVLKDVL